MSGISELLTTVGGGVAAAAGEQLGYALGNATGYNERLRQDQLKQQRALTDIQYNANYALMKGSYAEQKALWDATNTEAQVKHLKAAGLNPGLMYAKGGTGGTTGGGSASVGGGNASDESSRRNNNIAAQGMALQMQKLASEIKVNESVAEINKAQASKASAETKTTEATREGIISEIANKIKNLEVDTTLKSEQAKLSQLQQNSTEIANNYNEKNNLTLLESNLGLLRSITAKANVDEANQNNLLELSKMQVKQVASNILLNNSKIELNEADKALISSKIDEIANSITVSNKQLDINEQQLYQALDISKMNLSTGSIGKELRGLRLAILNAITGRNDYK